VLYVREMPPPSLSAVLETFVLLVERGRVRAEWRSAQMGSGGLCVTVGGNRQKQWLYADNWICKYLVNSKSHRNQLNFDLPQGLVPVNISHNRGHFSKLKKSFVSVRRKCLFL